MVFVDFSKCQHKIKEALIYIQNTWDPKHRDYFAKSHWPERDDRVNFLLNRYGDSQCGMFKLI